MSTSAVETGASAPEKGDGPGSNVAEYTVSELSGALKKVVERSFDHVRVRGEIGRVSRPGSGHLYLDLKDERSVLAAVIWKGTAARMRVQPEQGLEVVAIGKLTTFAGQSRYQLVIESIEPAGVGALMALLEERKKKFQAEGLFEEARKTRLPFLPRVIGIITSPTGAVIRDMMHGFQERFPARVIVWPVRVQGESSAREVTAAVQGFNALARGGPIPRPDVLIVARGGGSIEDLWGFNEEIVVRAVASSEIPVISAVGHETDWTLIDLVADARAPTPTKAAEWAVPKFGELMERLSELSLRLHQRQRRALGEQRVRLHAAARGLPRLQELIGLPRQRFDAAAGRHGRALLMNTQAHRSHCAVTSARLRPAIVLQRIALGRERMMDLDHRGRRALANVSAKKRQLLNLSGQLLGSLSYQAVLQRGFAVVRNQTGGMVRSANDAAREARLEVQFHDGRVVVATGDMPAKENKPDDRKRQPGKRSTPGNQGNLF